VKASIVLAVIIATVATALADDADLSTKSVAYIQQTARDDCDLLCSVLNEGLMDPKMRPDIKSTYELPSADKGSACARYHNIYGTKLYWDYLKAYQSELDRLWHLWGRN
jgi:hypothetical protein